MMELKPCPFSGKKAKLSKTRTLSGRVKYYVHCGFVRTDAFTKAKAAIKIWNTRATDSEED